MRRKYVIIVELCMTWTLLPALNGGNSYKNGEKTYNFSIKSEM